MFPQKRPEPPGADLPSCVSIIDAGTSVVKDERRILLDNLVTELDASIANPSLRAHWIDG